MKLFQSVLRAAAAASGPAAVAYALMPSSSSSSQDQSGSTAPKRQPKHTCGIPLSLPIVPASAVPYEPIEQQAGVGPLKHVTVIARHGDRAPIRGVLGSWKFSKEDAKFWEARLPASAVEQELDNLCPVRGKPDAPTDAKWGAAPRGQLTALGVQQAKGVGQWLRAAYGPDGVTPLLPAHVSTEEEAAAAVAARSTNVRRCQLTAGGILLGLWPSRDESGSRVARAKTPVRVRPHMEETMYSPPKVREQTRAAMALRVMERQLIAEGLAQGVGTFEGRVRTISSRLGVPSTVAAEQATQLAACAANAKRIGRFVDWTARRSDEAALTEDKDLYAMLKRSTRAALESGFGSVPNTVSPEDEDDGIADPASPDSLEPSQPSTSITVEFPWYTLREISICSAAHHWNPTWHANSDVGHGQEAQTRGGVPLAATGIAGEEQGLVDGCGAAALPWALGTADAVAMVAGLFHEELLSDLESAAGLTRRSGATDADGAPAKLSLLVGHDSTLAPLLAALRIWRGDWPPYASTVAFELYAPEQPGGSHWIRVLYNGRPLPVASIVAAARREAATTPGPDPLTSGLHRPDLHGVPVHSGAVNNEAALVKLEDFTWFWRKYARAALDPIEHAEVCNKAGVAGALADMVRE